jgi:hypothetical protein
MYQIEPIDLLVIEFMSGRRFHYWDALHTFHPNQVAKVFILSSLQTLYVGSGGS